jgi:MFS family permease
MFLYSSLSLVAGAIWLLTVKAGPRKIPKEGEGKVGNAQVLLMLLKNRDVLLLCIIYFLFIGSWVAFMGVYPALAVEGRGLAPQVANFVISITMLTYIVGCFALPTFSDKIGLRRPVYSFGALLSGLSLFLICISGPPMIWMWAVVCGIATGVEVLLSVMPMEMPRVGPDIGGAAMGLIISCGSLGGFLFLMVAAGLSSGMDPVKALVWIGVICGIIGASSPGLMVWMIEETGPKGRRAITHEEIEQQLN